jgi:hypothetical protein
LFFIQELHFIYYLILSQLFFIFLIGQQNHSLELVDTMIKKFQRSSADHVLQIPHLLRTPQTLLRTIAYIEEKIMNMHDNNIEMTNNSVEMNNLPSSSSTIAARIMNNDKEIYSSLFIYLFCWDRYRMIAKDFTLQHGVLKITSGT